MWGSEEKEVRLMNCAIFKASGGFIRGCTGKIGQIFFALESYENWGSYQDSAKKESSKISGKKIDRKVTFWWKKDLEKSFYQCNAAMPLYCEMLHHGLYSQKSNQNCCLYSFDGVHEVLLGTNDPCMLY
jgi:hypothetical protein